MNLVLDSGGVSALAGRRARMRAFRERGQWPPVVPAAVLVESLTGDARRDFHVNRLLSVCSVRDVDEALARRAATLRTDTGRAGAIAVTDAIVVALAERVGGATVLTSDPDDIADLASMAAGAIAVERS
jgi:predicted nucleic acid-binding protein